MEVIESYIPMSIEATGMAIHRGNRRLYIHVNLGHGYGHA